MAYYYSDANDELKKKVWQKAKAVEGDNPDVWRKDICGKWIKYFEHGENTKFGWEIDHIKPTAKGGGDELTNLQPLYWETNRDKGDTFPWSCP